MGAGAERAQDGDLPVTSNHYPDDRIVIPHWLAEKIRERYGSLEAYRNRTGVKVVDDYWQRLNSETQTRINERFARMWRRG